MDKLAVAIHEDAREVTARHTYRALTKIDRPDVGVACIIRAIDEWYYKGLEHGRKNTRATDEVIRVLVEALESIANLPPGNAFESARTCRDIAEKALPQAQAYLKDIK